MTRARGFQSVILRDVIMRRSLFNFTFKSSKNKPTKRLIFTNGLIAATLNWRLMYFGSWKYISFTLGSLLPLWRRSAMRTKATSDAVKQVWTTSLSCHRAKVGSHRGHVASSLWGHIERQRTTHGLWLRWEALQIVVPLILSQGLRVGSPKAVGVTSHPTLLFAPEVKKRKKRNHPGEKKKNLVNSPNVFPEQIFNFFCMRERALQWWSH